PRRSAHREQLPGSDDQHVLEVGGEVGEELARDPGLTAVTGREHGAARSYRIARGGILEVGATECIALGSGKCPGEGVLGSLRKSGAEEAKNDQTGECGVL